MDLRPQDDDSMTRTATQRLAETLPGEVNLSEIEAAVRDQVRELRSTARVQNFIGIIAERNAREMLTQGAAREH
jgi:hypothetical protein